MKHFLDINKTNVNDLNQILDQAKKTKATRAGFANGANDIDQTLSGKMVALIFEKPSCNILFQKQNPVIKGISNIFDIFII